jgi:3-oxoacyl-[acyl-carrier protein] reductase
MRKDVDMDLGIDGKVAVVSGGSRGAGRAIAAELAAEGVRVVLAARSPGPLEEAVEGIRASGGAAIGVAADMTDLDGIAAVVDRARAEFGDPDIAVTNVYPPDAPYRLGFEEATLDQYQQGHDALVMSLVHLYRLVVPAMKQKRWGRLVNIGSGIVRQLHAPPSVMVLSNIGRLAAVGLMKSLAFELGVYNITANVVATGSIATERPVAYFAGLGSSVEDEERKMAEAPFPLGVPRLGRPDEMAALTAFLCSERASYVSGEVIGVNGAHVRAPL